MNPRVIFASLLLSGLAGATLPHPVDLRCDGSVDPLGSGPTPHLTWRIESETRGLFTRAFQILVATSAEVLAKDEGDLWDFSTRKPSREPGAIYAGKALSVGDRCHWKIRWWSEGDEPSSWSEPAVWEVAPVKPADWQGAQWIDDGRENPEADEDFYKPDPAPLMRREFSIEKPVVRARLHIAGIGLCLPSLNGREIADHAFDPPWTNFDKRILFRTHDLTEQIVKGQNCLGLELGNGWFNPLPLRMWGHRNIRGSLPVGRPRAIACLVVEHPDGTTTTVTTDSEWKTAPGPTIRNSIYLGEERDARLAVDGWNEFGFRSSAWKPVNVVEHPLDALQPLRMPPVRLLEPIAAEKITSPGNGVHIVDFGQNFTGVPEIKIDAPAGTRVTLRFGELLHEDGTLNPMTSVCGQIKGMKKGPDDKMMPKGGPGGPEVAWQQSVFISDGKEPAVFRPQFTFHAFRYMEITGLPKAPGLEDCRALPLHTDLASVGDFSCSDDGLNVIQQICRRTFLANVVSVQSDCPHRERFGYGGDIVATSEAYLMNFDMAGFYAKTVRDWSDAARPDGNFTDTAPFVGIQYCGVGWAMVHPLLLEQLYQHYGNRRLIEQELPAAIKWFNLEASKREDGLVVKGLGDHEALKRIAGPVITTPMFIDTARRMARLCRVVGRADDSIRFDRMAEESAAAWAGKFLDTKTGKVGGGSQSEQVLAIAFDAVPVPSRKAVFDYLVADLTNEPEDPSLTTGIFGTRFLMELLSQRGHHDLAAQLATRRTFPSWGWMLENGATTLWEHWKGSADTYSHNHPMFGSISAWFFRHLGGIQPTDDAVGFNRVTIRPQLVDGLDWVRTTHHSIRGPVVSNWQVEDGIRTFEIEVPVDSQAVIELPRREGDRLTEGGTPIDPESGTRVVEDIRSFRIVTGSGRYRFEVAPKP